MVGAARLVFSLCLSACAILGPAARLIGQTTQPISSHALLLDSRDPVHDQDGDDSGLLVRELMRQAVLIAARDEMGLPTRDASLRESTTPELGRLITVSTEAKNAAYLKLMASLASDNAKTFKLEKTFEAGPYADPDPRQNGKGKIFDIAHLATVLEPLSRKSLPARLKELGIESSEVKPASSADVPADAKLLMRDTSYVSQYAAIRSIHRAIREQGQSPALLSALSRAYVNLGQLTIRHWTAAPKVFFARALLYAERLVDLEKRSPASLRNRAYVRALAGLPAAALDDMNAADKSAKADETVAVWEKSIIPFCQSDTAALANLALANALDAPLMMLLSFITVEHSHSAGAIIQMGNAALEVGPVCPRILGSMNDEAGVSYRGMLAHVQPRIQAYILSREITRLPEFAKNAEALPHRMSTDAWTAPAVVAKVIERLQLAGENDDLEPSLNVLARLVQEENFQIVMQQVRYTGWYLRIGAAAALDPARAGYASHPYADYLESCRYGWSHSDAGVGEKMRDVKIVDLELKEGELAVQAGLTTRGRTYTALPAPDAVRHADAIASDMEALTEASGQVAALPLLKKLCPDSPIVAGYEIRYDWLKAEQKVQAYEQRWGNHPAVSGALMTKFFSDGLTEEARRNALRYISRSPDGSAYVLLADTYKREGDMDKYVATLKESLRKSDDYGLDHMWANVQIAYEYLRLLDPKSAEPYAAVGAESYAQAGMICAQRCYEALQNWEKDEQWVMAECSRYQESPFKWYFWCQRTNHGNLAGARQAVDAYLSQNQRSAPAFYVVAFYRLENRTTDLEKYIQERLRNDDVGAEAMLLAIQYDETNNAKGRDGVLRLVDHQSNASPRRADHSYYTARYYLNQLAGQPMAQAVRMIDPQETEGDGVGFFWGWLLGRQGEIDRAYTYLINTAQSQHNDEVHMALAAVEFRKLQSRKPK